MFSEKDLILTDLPSLNHLFAEDTKRLDRFSIELGPLYFDFAKTHLTADTVAEMAERAEKMDFAAKRKQLVEGQTINNSEGRAAEHMAERGSGNAQSVSLAKERQARMRSLVDAIEAGAFGEMKHLLHVGIGGSALGPKLLVDALGRENAKFDVHIASNVDGSALAEIFARIDPAKTLLAVASKTFTTTETLMNAESVIAWMRESGVEDPYGRVVALTANPEKAVEWGVEESRILPFSETVGGRYSLWCSIGFPAALGLGWQAYEEMLEGAGEMDRHFLTATPERNAPMLAAFVDRYYIEQAGAETRAVFAYDERLRLLPDYLQQLEMESNGKQVTADGRPLATPSAAITWGGVGTDAQHAVFQLLHQGTHLVPVEFIASLTPGHDLDAAHHETLLINAFAQGAALMAGKTNPQDPARHYPGNRPSTTILLDDVSPRALGGLIAFYEHRTFVNAMLIGINPFDQFGVELGKQIAKSIATDGPSGFDPSTSALISRTLG